MKSIICLFLVTVLCGCSSIASRVGEDSQAGSPYNGLEFALDNAGACNFGALLMAPPLVIVTIPASLIDVAGSAVVDTLLLPVDLLMETPEGSKQSPCHVDWSH